MAKLFLSLAVFVICAFTQTGTDHDYNEAISFTIDKIEEGKVIMAGGGNVNAKKGMKFVFVYMTFTNKTADQQDVDFNRFSLADGKVKYKLEKVMLTGAINQFRETEATLESKDALRRKLVFAAPSRLKPQNLFVNGKMIPLENKGTTPKR